MQTFWEIQAAHQVTLPFFQGEKGALIFALQLLLPDMTGSHADVTKKSDTFLAALTHALLESDYGASGPPKEVHLVVDAPEEIITCRKCVERVIAKRSDPVAAEGISKVCV